MSEAPEVTFDAPVNKKKVAKKKVARPRAAAVDKRPSAPFPGLTRTQCASACNADSCAISLKPYCAHPTKGALQASDMNNPAAMKRMQQARNQIDVSLDPDRFK